MTTYQNRRASGYHVEPIYDDVTIPPEYAAIARAVLTRWGADDLADMLGIGACKQDKSPLVCMERSTPHGAAPELELEGQTTSTTPGRTETATPW